MTSGKSVAAYGKSLMGRPYKEIDCIKLVVLSIRNGVGASGESRDYCCGGCNELWRSLNASGKYRYVTERIELNEAISKGLLLTGALLAIWEPGYNTKYEDFEGDCSHIGIYVGDRDCEVIHSSQTRECVAASTLKNGWTHVLIHRLIDLGADESTGMDYTPLERPYEATVCTDKDPLTIRDRPDTSGNALGKVKKGGCMTVVGVVQVDNTGREWLPVEAQPDNRRGAVCGWAAAEYLTQPEDDEPPLFEDDQDGVIVPRETMLALADAVNMIHSADAYDVTGYLNGVNALIDAAQAVTACLKGDD